MKLPRELLISGRAFVAFTVLLGVLYPLAVTGVAQVAFPGHANGSKVAAGSRLIAKPRVIETGATDASGGGITRPDPRYFQPRPSATGYSATVTYFANRGPNQASARYFYRDRLRAYLALEREYSPGLGAADVPIDAVTDSGSGVDPHVTVANARIQARRVGKVRRIGRARLAELIRAHTDGRFLVFGERGVNVTTLNLALDEEIR